MLSRLPSYRLCDVLFLNKSLSAQRPHSETIYITLKKSTGKRLTAAIEHVRNIYTF